MCLMLDPFLWWHLTRYCDRSYYSVAKGTESVNEYQDCNLAQLKRKRFQIWISNLIGYRSCTQDRRQSIPVLQKLNADQCTNKKQCFSCTLLSPRLSECDIFEYAQFSYCIGKIFRFSMRFAVYSVHLFEDV